MFRFRAGVPSRVREPYLRAVLVFFLPFSFSLVSRRNPAYVWAITRIITVARRRARNLRSPLSTWWTYSRVESRARSIFGHRRDGRSSSRGRRRLSSSSSLHRRSRNDEGYTQSDDVNRSSEVSWFLRGSPGVSCKVRFSAYFVISPNLYWLFPYDCSLGLLVILVRTCYYIIIVVMRRKCHYERLFLWLLFDDYLWRRRARKSRQVLQIIVDSCVNTP